MVETSGLDRTIDDCPLCPPPPHLGDAACHMVARGGDVTLHGVEPAKRLLTLQDPGLGLAHYTLVVRPRLLHRLLVHPEHGTSLLILGRLEKAFLLQKLPD
jgi:hypothetical protein